MPHTHAHAHGPDDGHHHDHGLAAGGSNGSGALRIALGLTLLLLVGESVGGYLSNSLALLADAGHVLTDAGALGLSLFVAWFCRQQGSAEKTYGYLRWEILAALINGATLLGISAWILIEAVLRLRTPEPVHGGLMLVVAVVGLAVNAIAALVLHPVHEGSLNVRGAYLHVLGDLLASVGTVVAAVVIRYTGWLDADPLASLLSTALIMRGAWSLVRESVDVLLESAPSNFPLAGVKARLEAIPGVENVHDLHVWTVTSGLVAASAHALVRDPHDHQRVLERAHDVLHEMGIRHVTMQIERTEMGPRDAESAH
ncbi:MAG: cation transporter [Gemmatimonadota bacterium]|nr:cation transporter [Gemmatimonadota bacterium]MDE3127574.1 cation transporter [Gemmatimonadota bacterium]MDE3171824.1 cation transporter [Gemmatimonadota bacterium]